MSEAKETAETAHAKAARKQWALQKAAAERAHFKFVNGEAVPYKIAMPAADLATTAAAVKQAEEKARERLVEEARKPGDKMPDGTIYLGKYAPRDREGMSLGLIFNVFAAPRDLGGTMKYAEAVQHISEIQNWHGYKGTNYADDREIYQALKDGSYTGGWIIPTRELLMGAEADAPWGTHKNIVQPDNLFDHKDTGSFKGTFTTAAGMNGSVYSDCYWSSTMDSKLPTAAWSVHFSDGANDWFCSKRHLNLSCRPVRLVPCKTA